MAFMSAARFEQYQTMQAQIRNSPLFKAWGQFFDPNQYLFKAEYLLPFGQSHYARIFLQLLLEKEQLEIIQPGDTLLETTSGSGGRAAAVIATSLGYKIHIGIPAGGEKARELAIINAGGILHFTPAPDYVAGFPAFVKQFLDEQP
jgi:cysteine synthase